MGSLFSYFQSIRQIKNETRPESLPNNSENYWDPEQNVTLFPRDYSNQCLMRIRVDIQDYFQSPPDRIIAFPDENNVTIIHAIFVGPQNTPYENGFFHYLLRFPDYYPDEPLLVKNLTTDDGHVRFNPALHADGKVCLSILETSDGPEWTPAQNLTSVLESIQSLMNEWPMFNEPKFAKSKHAKQYNEYIVHETLRVAVCKMLEKSTRASECCPESLWPYVEKLFLKNYDFYMSLCKKHMALNGKVVFDPFRESKEVYEFKGILERLDLIRGLISKKYEETELQNVTVDYSELTRKMFPYALKRKVGDSSCFEDGNISADEDDDMDSEDEKQVLKMESEKSQENTSNEQVGVEKNVLKESESATAPALLFSAAAKLIDVENLM